MTDALTGEPLTEDLNRMFATMNDSDFVLIQYYVFGKLFQDINYFKTPSSAGIVIK